MYLHLGQYSWHIAKTRKSYCDSFMRGMSSEKSGLHNLLKSDQVILQENLGVGEVFRECLSDIVLDH